MRNLTVSFPRRGRGPVVPVDGISFHIAAGERVGLVGESGSGKSLTALALMGLINREGGQLGHNSSILFRGADLVRTDERQLRRIRGADIAMIFQDPLTSLNPVHSVGRQVLEAISLHRPDMHGQAARDLAVELLAQVRLPRPKSLVDSYPHELSGGMRQRVMIAMALAGDPALLIADEPTTALDVTIQAEILDLLHDLSERRGLSVLLITHDLGIVAGFTQRVLVMYGGRIVETGPTDSLYQQPRHPYTAALLQSIAPMDRRAERLLAIPGSPPEPTERPEGCVFQPRCEFAEPRCSTESPELRIEGALASRTFAVAPKGGDLAARNIESTAACLRSDELDLSASGSYRGGPVTAPAGPVRNPPEAILSVQNLTKQYRVKGARTWKRTTFTAVSGVSFDVLRGEALGIVGESGSGKSTLARCLVRLIEPSDGKVAFNGEEVYPRRPDDMRAFRRKAQMIFQDPGSSLDPRMRVGEILAEPLRIHKLWGQAGYDGRRLVELLDTVQLPKDALNRYPHQFSGGQRQRIAIARALTLRPTILLCDEPVSALDVSVRSSILNLLADLRDQLELTLIFIAHDLSLVRFLCDRVGVMHEGQLVELRSNSDLFATPRHNHTKELLEAQPAPDPARERQQRQRRRTVLGPNATSLC